MLALVSGLFTELCWHVSGGTENTNSYPLHWAPQTGNNNIATAMLPAVCHRLVVVAYA